MNPDTGHLVDTTGKTREELEKLFRDGYEPVPKGLIYAATTKLNGNSEAYVSKNSGGILSKFATKLRKKKRRMQKQSRISQRK